MRVVIKQRTRATVRLKAISYSPATKATEEQVTAGTDNVRYMTPYLTAQQANGRLASQAEAEAGSDNTKTMTPLRSFQGVMAQRGAVLASDVGAVGDGVTDDTAALETGMAKAVGANNTFKLLPGKTYVVSTLTIPDDLTIEAAGATIARVGTVTARPSFISIGKRVTADELNFTFDGSEEGSIPASALVRADEDFTCGTLSVSAASQLGYPDAVNGFISNGIRTRIDRPRFKNVDYGIVLFNESLTDRADGSVIGVIEMESYLRAFYGLFASFKCAGIHAVGRSPNAALLGSDGENGRYQSNLYEGCSDFEMGDVYMLECGHGARIGGSPHANAQTRNAKFGDFYLEGARGCAFKVNPTLEVSTGVTETAHNISVGDIVSVDGADGTYEGNRDFIRLSHVRGVKIGQCSAQVRNDTYSHQDGVLLNDAQDVQIESVHGDNFRSAFVTISGTSDSPPGFGSDVLRCSIGRLSGKCAGSNAIVVADAFNYGDISIGLDGIEGFTTRLFAWFTSGTLTGEFRLRGWVGGTVLPVYLSAPNDIRFRVDVEWAGKRGIGRANGLAHRAAVEIGGTPMDIGASPATGEFGGMFITNLTGTAGDGAIGGNLGFGRPGGIYRNAAVGALQFGATAASMGLGFWTSGTSSSNHVLALSATLRTDGNYELVRNNKGIILQSPDGTRYLVRVANGGTISITAAPT